MSTSEIGICLYEWKHPPDRGEYPDHHVAALERSHNLQLWPMQLHGFKQQAQHNWTVRWFNSSFSHILWAGLVLLVEALQVVAWGGSILKNHTINWLSCQTPIQPPLTYSVIGPESHLFLDRLQYSHFVSVCSLYTSTVLHLQALMQHIWMLFCRKYHF